MLTTSFVPRMAEVSLCTRINLREVRLNSDYVELSRYARF